MEVRRGGSRGRAEGRWRRASDVPAELYALFDPNVALVDVVVECDHFVSELLVTLLERLDRAAQCAQHELTLLLQRRLEQVELFLKSRPHPNRPVT